MDATVDVNGASLARQLLQREQERQAALVADDMDAFAALLCDDIVHVHATGNVHGKRDLLGHAGGFLRFLSIERGDLKIRPLGSDAAVMTGPMTNTVTRRGHDERVVVEAFVTQVWVREGENWKIKSFHAVRVPSGPGGPPAGSNDQDGHK